MKMKKQMPQQQTKKILQTDAIIKLDNSNPSDELVAVIVTIKSGSSYDNLFREHKQESEQGTRVSLYDLHPDLMQPLLAYFESGSTAQTDPVFLQMLADLSGIDGDCVVFNFECCSGCNYKEFPNSKIAPAFVHMLLSRQ